MMYSSAIFVICFIASILAWEDTVFVPSLELTVVDDGEAQLHFKNLVISGLKNKQPCDISNFLLGKSKNLKTHVNVKLTGELTLDFTKTSKSFNGHFTYEAIASIMAESNNGSLDHCEVDKLYVTADSELKKAISEDEELFHQNVRKVFCSVVKKAFNELYINGLD